MLKFVAERSPSFRSPENLKAASCLPVMVRGQSAMNTFTKNLNNALRALGKLKDTYQRYGSNGSATCQKLESIMEALTASESRCTEVQMSMEADTLKVNLAAHEAKVAKQAQERAEFLARCTVYREEHEAKRRMIEDAAITADEDVTHHVCQTAISIHPSAKVNVKGIGTESRYVDANPDKPFEPLLEFDSSMVVKFPSSTSSSSSSSSDDDHADSGNRSPPGSGDESGVMEVAMQTD